MADKTETAGSGLYTGDTLLRNAAKDFAMIVEDYEFFMAHSTEAEHDARDYQFYLERPDRARSGNSHARLRMWCGRFHLQLSGAHAMVA